MGPTSTVQNGSIDVQRELLERRYAASSPVDPVLPGTKTAAPQADEKHAFASQDWFERSTDRADGGRTALQNLLKRMKGLADAAAQRDAAGRVEESPLDGNGAADKSAASPAPPASSWAASNVAAAASAPAAPAEVETTEPEPTASEPEAPAPEPDPTAPAPESGTTTTESGTTTTSGSGTTTGTTTTTTTTSGSGSTSGSGNTPNGQGSGAGLLKQLFGS